MTGFGKADDAPAAPLRPPRFRAFISYSHADAAAAVRLQRRLEGYRVPRGLAERIAPLGERDAASRGRVGPIFRDLGDLSASADLSAAIRAGLAESGALIVLCSPGAQRSPWVAREIELFRAIHPDRPVLAALIAGEPHEAFPPALTRDGLEPLAADFRQVGDGWGLAVLKVVAGILELPLDQLIRRDAKRHQRRVMAVTLAALTALLVLSAMTMLAISARREAERQRTEAEGLVEFMLTDLRQRLKAVGRLDVMSDVNRRAMDYYAHQGSPAALPEASLERRARVVGAMGEDAENGGDLPLAQARYELLHRTTAALLAKRPDDPERVFAHAQSENRLALLALTRDRPAEALERFDRTNTQLARIARWGRNRPEWLRLSAFGHGNRCATRLSTGIGRAEALAECERAVADAERLSKLASRDAAASYDLVFHYLWLAEAQHAAGKGADMRRTQARYLALSDRLVARDPDNMLLREQQMQLYVRHAELLRTRGEHGGARRFLELARATGEVLVARDPANAIWARYRSRIDDELKQGTRQ